MWGSKSLTCPSCFSEIECILLWISYSYALHQLRMISIFVSKCMALLLQPCPMLVREQEVKIHKERGGTGSDLMAKFHTSKWTLPWLVLSLPECPLKPLVSISGSLVVMWRHPTCPRTLALPSTSSCYIMLTSKHTLMYLPYNTFLHKQLPLWLFSQQCEHMWVALCK